MDQVSINGGGSVAAAAAAGAAGNPPKRFREGADDNVTDLMSHLQRMGTSARSKLLAAPSKLTNTFVGSKGAPPSAIQRADDADAAAEAKGDPA
jgi:hypothetical protein